MRRPLLPRCFRTARFRKGSHAAGEFLAKGFELFQFLLLPVDRPVQRFDLVFLERDFFFDAYQSLVSHGRVRKVGQSAGGGHCSAGRRSAISVSWHAWCAGLLVGGAIQISHTLTMTSARPPSARSLVAHLKRGGVIAYPTESCYGLGCDPRNRNAVRRILKLKQRPQHKGLILIAAHFHQVADYLQAVAPADQVQLRNDAAQAVTYLMPTRPACPRWLRGKHDTLAVRLTAHPYAKMLCRRAGSALVSTSANRSGRRAAKTYAECRRLFGERVWVLRGQVGKRKQPSTIRDWASGRVLR